jgi:hypothetical protein
MTSPENTKVYIERAIGRARSGVGERIDEIDRLIRARLDWRQQAGQHAPELVAAGAALGFFIGVGGGRVLVRAMQVAIPIALAVQLARRHAASDPESPL